MRQRRCPAWVRSQNHLPVVPGSGLWVWVPFRADVQRSGGAGGCAAASAESSSRPRRADEQRARPRGLPACCVLGALRSAGDDGQTLPVISGALASSRGAPKEPWQEFW